MNGTFCESIARKEKSYQDFSYIFGRNILLHSLGKKKLG